MEEKINKTISMIVGASHDPATANMIPSEFMLNPSHPNPFNTVASITYTLDRDGFITLKLFDLAGREVTSLVNKRQRAGNYRTTWNAEGMPNGIYLVRLESGTDVAVSKIVLVK